MRHAVAHAAAARCRCCRVWEPTKLYDASSSCHSPPAHRTSSHATSGCRSTSAGARPQEHVRRSTSAGARPHQRRSAADTTTVCWWHQRAGANDVMDERTNWRKACDVCCLADEKKCSACTQRQRQRQRQGQGHVLAEAGTCRGNGCSWRGTRGSAAEGLGGVGC